MIDGNALADVGKKYLGVPYSEMDCQRFVEKCMADLGLHMDLAGSNAWYRHIMEHGRVLTPEECVRELGCVPRGAILFIHEYDGGEEKRGYHDGKGNASHMGICTYPKGKGAIASSASRGCVAESNFKEKSINGGWNMVGLYDQIVFDYGVAPDPVVVWRPTLRRGAKGEDVSYVQNILVQNGYDIGKAGVDGDFGRATEDAVKKFQRDHGLDPDGIVGPLTYEALEQATPSTKYTVTLHGVTQDDVNMLMAFYPNAEIKEE